MNIFRFLYILCSKRIKKDCNRILSLLLLSLFAVPALQAADITHDISTASLEILGTSTDNYIITGTTTTNTVKVGSGYHGTITLRNLSIKRSKNTDVSNITFSGEYNCSNLTPVTKVDLILDGVNDIEYTADTYSAIQVDQGAQIHIQAIDPNDNNSGTLRAISTNGIPGSTGASNSAGAGIGSRNYKYADPKCEGTSSSSCGSTILKTAGGNIIISSGKITAWGGRHAAGIGGGWYSYYNGIILIYGGIVEARSTYHAAGIGSGCPLGGGVTTCYADNSTIISLPPAEITAYGTGSGVVQRPDYGLTGAKNITYLNDPNQPESKVQTVDLEPNANIYLDLTETAGLSDIFNTLGITYDLTKVKMGKTDASGVMKFNGRFEQKTTFFTDASSSQPATSGRPYMPVETTVLGASTVTLPLLETDISFIDYPSTPLEVGYSEADAKKNAYRVKIEYKDPNPMTNVKFSIQGGVDFMPMTFFAADNATVISAPTTLNSGDVFYITLPLKNGKPIGIYSDVLMINADWKNLAIPGAIRRVVEQRVVYDDTENNKYIKVTASPNKFIKAHPATETITLNLNIQHLDISTPYDPKDVVAKYLVTTEPDYDKALAANPLKTWADMAIPTGENMNTPTTLSLADRAVGTYYIHWYVLSSVVYAHSHPVSDPPHQYGAFGKYIIYEPIKPGELTGNSFVCANVKPVEIKGSEASGGSGNFSYQWQQSTDGSTWSDISGATSLNYTPSVAAFYPMIFRRLAVDKDYAITTPSINTFSFNTIDLGVVLYWKKDAKDSNWNNSDNWADAGGASTGMVPVICSDVYIPSGADHYPSLDTKSTPIDTYGIPVCNNITFEYGAELAYQQKLTYSKAYIQYNWGYYDSSAKFGDQPNKNANLYLGTMKSRDLWYTLAAPLKNIASGDFSFAGYPFSWQAGFQMLDPITLDKGAEIEAGDFSKVFATNDVPLTSTNNAIAVKVASYENKVGYGDQKNLNNLRGVIQIPYFEDPYKISFYPAHSYDKISKESKFFYFNTNTLQLIHSPIGRIKRGNEAYRFVYENSSNQAPDITVTVGGVSETVSGYKQSVSRQHSVSQKIMVGNPFMASINPKRFYEVNKDKLKVGEGYQVFSSTHQLWNQHTYDDGSYIAPLQAFIVTLADGIDKTDLLYPLDGTNALTGATFRGEIQMKPQGNSLFLRSSKDNNEVSDYAIFGVPGTDEISNDVKKMIYPEGHSVPETFFIAPDGKDFNLVQTYQKGKREVGIGVKSSDTENTLTLTFDNVNKFFETSGIRPILVDKMLDFEQDLLTDNIYHFKQRKVSEEQKYIDTDRFLLKLYGNNEVIDNEDSSIQITYVKSVLKIESSEMIKDILVYDLYGRLVFNKTAIGSTLYSQTVLLSPSTYIVKVQLDNNKTKASKIVAL